MSGAEKCGLVLVLAGGFGVVWGLVGGLAVGVLGVAVGGMLGLVIGNN